MNVFFNLDSAHIQVDVLSHTPVLFFMSTAAVSTSHVGWIGYSDFQIFLSMFLQFILG